MLRCSLMADSRFITRVIGDELPTSDGQPYSVRRETVWFKKLREVVEEHPAGKWVAVWEGSKTIARVNRNAFKTGRMNTPRGHLFDFDVLTKTHMEDLPDNIGLCVVRWNGVDENAEEVDPLRPYEAETPEWLSFDPPQFRKYIKTLVTMGVLEDEVERWVQHTGIPMDWHAFTAEYGADLGATDEELAEARAAVSVQPEAAGDQAPGEGDVEWGQTLAEIRALEDGPDGAGGEQEADAGVAGRDEEGVEVDAPGAPAESDLDSLAEVEAPLPEAGSHVPEEVPAGDEEPVAPEPDDGTGAVDSGGVPAADEEPGGLVDASPVAPLEVQPPEQAPGAVDEVPVVADVPATPEAVQPTAPPVHAEPAPEQLPDDAPRPSTPEAGPAAVDDPVEPAEPVRECPEAPIGSDLKHEWWSPLQGAPPVCRWCNQEQPNTAELQQIIRPDATAVVAQPDGRSIQEMIAQQKAEGDVVKADEAIPGLEDLM